SPPPSCPLRARWPRLGPSHLCRRSAAQRVRNDLLPLVTAVQISHGGAGCRMPHAVHQLAQVGTLVRRELITGGAQVVKVNRREPCRTESRMPDTAAEVAAPQRLALGAGEH